MKSQQQSQIIRSLGREPEAMLHKLKSAKNAWALYLLHVAYGISLTHVGTLFGRDRTAVAHACTIIEDRRDDPAFDTLLDNLEIAVVRLTSALNSLKI